MTPFLKQVAKAYYEKDQLQQTCFIFPNRRSEVFFRKYLCDIVAAASEAASQTVSAAASQAATQNAATEASTPNPAKAPKPILSPNTFTVNDFIYKIYGIAPTNRIELLLELYEIYSSLNPKAEPLDDFIFWGDIILGDFGDIDKYLADASQLYTNISDLKNINDSYTYLTPNQRKAIEAFVSHFSDRRGRLTVDLKSENPKVKEVFLQIWNILNPLYVDFNKSLRQKGMAYEGMVYRAVAESFRQNPAEDVLAQKFPYTKTFVFTGLNALNECEKTLMRKMAAAGLAEFCWDYSGDMIRDRHNRSSFFMEENIREFPQSLTFDADAAKHNSNAANLPFSALDIRVIAVPSAVGQVKQLPLILQEIADNQTDGDLSKIGIPGAPRGNIDRSSKSADCAIVLPDEGLLMPVLNTIPLEIKDINVTMGYPIISSAFYMFMDLVIDVQMNIRKKADSWTFYNRAVRSLFADSIFKSIVGKDGAEKISKIKAESKLYIPAEDLDLGGIFSVIFQPVITDKTESSTELTDRLSRWLSVVIAGVIPALKKAGTDAVEIEFAVEYSRTIAALRRIGLSVKPQTYIHILKRILSPVSVPFKGEPLRGLQIMGPLETRAIDFENIVILSANEGVFPRRSVASSFIPPELRRGFGLPTYEYQDAVWAYYFYRMLSRAKNVWLLYDSRTQGVKSGEECRYIKQLQYHFGLPLKRYTVGVSLAGKEDIANGEIPKTKADVAKIKSMTFSASSIKKWLSCPAQFYYHYIKELGKEEEVDEVVDKGMLGTIFHKVMQTLYQKDGIMPSVVTEADILAWIKDKAGIKAMVKCLIIEKLHAPEVAGKNLVIADVIVSYVLKALSVDLEQLNGLGRKSFTCYGLEKYYCINFHGYKINGIIDRIDDLTETGLRVLDYKTGRVNDSENVDHANVQATADAIFATDIDQRPEILFQLYVYDKFMQQDPAFKGKPLGNCIFSTINMFKKPPQTDPVDDDFVSKVDEHLKELFSQMTDISQPFRLTENQKICQWCDFKIICGR